MKKEDLAFIGCRLLAIFWAIEAIDLFSHSAPVWFMESRNPPGEDLIRIMARMFHIAMITIPSLFLWFRADLIVGLLLPDAGEEESSGEITLQQAQTVAFATVGLFVLLSALPQMAFAFYPSRQFQMILLFTSVSKFALGLILFLKADMVSRTLDRFRQNE